MCGMYSKAFLNHVYTVGTVELNENEFLTVVGSDIVLVRFLVHGKVERDVIWHG